MNEGLAFMGVQASWTLSHSALPDAPVVPDVPRRRRRGVAVRVRLAHALHRVAEAVEPPPLPASGC